MPARSKSLLLGLGSLGAAVALPCAFVLLGLTVFELGYRIQTQRPVLVFQNWRAGRIEYLGFGEQGAPDPTLGWKPKEWYSSDGYNTLDYGIRRNFDESDIRTGGVLAVGDSFTNPPELPDEETWPAHLERIMSMPVVNAGVVGYGADQVVLRAEQLMAAVQPKILIVGLLDEVIDRAGYSSFGAPKPYFTLEQGALKHHPPGRIVLYDESPDGWNAVFRRALGYSAVLDTALGHLAPRYWTGKAGEQVHRKADNDPVAITCALLQRLKREADGKAIRLLLFMQHGWKRIIENERPSATASQVTDCAKAAAIDVVDQFESLRRIAVASADALRTFFVSEGDGFGDMSSPGNQHAASLLARALGKP